VSTVAVQAAVGQLTGFTVAVTADRRRDELTALLRRQGARVVGAPLVRIAPIEDDGALRGATQRCLEAPLDYVVATTGVGWRGWMSAAEGWGLGNALRAACAQAMVLSRGPKASGAVRASGLREAWSPESEATDEVLAWLLEQPLEGKRIALQEHGAPLTEFVAALREKGAEVIEVPVYRWLPPEDRGAASRLVDSIIRRDVHAVTFTSAPAVTALLTAAGDDRRLPLLAAFSGVVEESNGLASDSSRARGDTATSAAPVSGGVLAACIGPVCARPFTQLSVPVVWPRRGRLGELARLVGSELQRRGTRRFVARGTPITVQGSAVLLPNDTIFLPPAPSRVLWALSERPGRVFSRGELLRRAWPNGQGDARAVETAVARLRGCLGEHSWLVVTVTKRGYRLAVDT